MSSAINNLINNKSHMKFLISIFVLIYSSVLLSQEANLCNNLECMDEVFKNKNYVRYYNILNKTLIDARGCKDNVKLDNVLEFTTKIVNKTASRERMSKFIEREFINNPACILSAMHRISQPARNATAVYLAKPTYFNRKKIKSVLAQHQQQYPAEAKLIHNLM